MSAPHAPPQGQPVPLAANALHAMQMQPGSTQNGLAPPAAPPAPITHDVTVLTTKKLAQAKVLGVPPEEFGIERGARDIKSCNYCFHEVVTKTEAQLIAEGFDEEQVKALSDYTGNTEIETLARDSVGEHFSIGGDSANSAARLVKITEHYVRMDYEGNGRPCLYQVITGGDQGDILRKDGKESITPFDAIPFAAWTPVPVTHRFFGRSVADLVMPAQREKTAIKRGGLDNLYLHNNPRVEVPKAACGPNTLDDLLTSRPGGIYRTEQPGMIQWQVVPDITASIYPMLQYLDAEIESRTGLTKQGQGIDADALQNQSATAVAQVFSSSQMRMKLIARLLAQGVKEICSLLHGTIRKHGQEAQTVRLRNTWVQVDPRNWKTRNDMTINVGLGTGSKAQQYAQTMALANYQKELLLGGKVNLVGDQELFNTGVELCKLLGHKNADKFINDPSAKDPKTGQLLHPPVPPPPDPKLQVEQLKQQGKQAENAQQGQLDQQKAQLDAYHEQVQAAADLQVKQFEAQVKERLAILDGHIKVVLAEQKMRHDQQSHHLDTAGKVVDIIATAHQHDTKMEQGAQSHDAKLQQMKQSKPKGNGK